MAPKNAFARDVRLRRLFRHGDRLLVVPLDHSVTDGPIIRRPGGLDELVGEFARSEVDAIVVHKGSTRQLDHRWFADLSLIIHLSASTMHAADPDAKYLVATVPEALRLSADAVSVHLNLGSREEARQVRDLAAVAAACDAWNLPLLVMAYPRGPQITNPRDPALVAHAATLSADLGADIVKVPYTGSVAAMTDVVRACPIPVIVAGGPQLGGTAEILRYVDQVMQAGAAGLAMGRNIFQAPDPGDLARQIARRIRLGAHDPARSRGGQLAALAGHEFPRRRWRLSGSPRRQGTHREALLAGHQLTRSAAQGARDRRGRAPADRRHRQQPPGGLRLAPAEREQGAAVAGR